MAKNLRRKIPKEDSLYIYDLNTEALHKFVKELSGHTVAITKSAREVAEHSVSNGISCSYKS